MDYLELVEAEGTALIDSTAAHLDAPVPSCPGWDSRRLLRHVGRLLHTTAVTVPRGTIDPPPPNPPAPTDDGELIAYARRALVAAVAALRDTDPATPAWNFTGIAPPVAGFWRRRLTHELAIHRWDADNAVGLGRPPAADLAADGIDELLSILLPAARAIGGNLAPMDGTIHIHLTDTDLSGVEGEWLVRLAGPAVTLTREHAKGDAALRGPAGTVLLAVWGRVPFEQPELSAFGDVALLPGLRSGR